MERLQPDQKWPLTILFKSVGNPTYRIPALIYVDDCKTFFAFAEKRRSENDSEAEFLVMRRGKRQNKQIDWSPLQELTTARLPGHRTMNPCPVYEKESKTLFLFFICVKDGIKELEQIKNLEKARNTTRLGYVTSNDNGENWSSMTDLTEQLIGSEIDRWATFAVGPGHGIQMKSGRLIIPAYVYYITKESPSNSQNSPSIPHALAIYSDDKGQKWKLGEKLEMESIECQMAEIPNQSGKNHLYCNARSAQGSRREAWSENCETWNIANSKELEETGKGCQGSVLSFPAPVPEKISSSTSSTNTWLLYSHPSYHDKRKDLGIYLKKSTLDTPGWEKPWIIHRGPSGYSDLTQCEGPHHFACLMECGDEKEYESIALVEFTLSDVIKNMHQFII